MFPEPSDKRYGWNTGASRYIDTSTGRFVSRVVVARELERVITASEVQIMEVSMSYLNGEITLSEWQILMERSIKSIHTSSAALAIGGWNQMDYSDWGRTGSMIKKQYWWLDNFANDVHIGKQRLGSFLRRAQLYAQAGRGTYEEMRRVLAEHHGFIEERRLLAPAEHCNTCVLEAEKDWQPIGTLRQIGDSECRTNCLCRFMFR